MPIPRLTDTEFERARRLALDLAGITLLDRHRDGDLTEVSAREARLHSSMAPAVLSNLKIIVAGPPGLARIRFTSLTPGLNAWAASS